MACAQTFEEEFLTCAICTEIYINPCTLACQHSFCQNCVTQYVKTRPDCVRSKTIPCAFCCQVSRVPDPTKPADKWARQFKPSIMLQGLMDRHRRGYKLGQDVCFVCAEIEETTAASSWCSDCEITLCNQCVKRHLKVPATKKHDVFDLSEGVKVKQRRKVKCKEHEGEEIKFVCKDCNKSACQTCCIIIHRACRHVVTITSMMSEIKSALTEIRRTLGRKMTESIANVKKEESIMMKLGNSKTVIETEIGSAIQTILIMVRQKKMELLEEAEDVSDKQIAEFQASMKLGQITTQMYLQHCEFIDQALQSESEMDIYDAYQVCQSGAMESVGGTKSGTRYTPDVEEVKFIPNIERVRKAVAEMGKIDVTYLLGETHLAPSGQKVGADILSNPVLHDTINIQHTEDFWPPGLIDVTALTIRGMHTMVVVDDRNNHLKSICMKNDYKVISILQLTEEPYRVAKVSGNRVAVTVDNCHVVVANVRPTLVLIDTLKVGKQYYGIAALSNSTLAVGSTSPAAIDILDLSGNVLRSITPSNTGLNLIQQPRYLCTTREVNILVSDWDSESVYCLTTKGDVVFTYKQTGYRALRETRGITVTHTGDILLADGETTHIIQLTSDGEFVRDIILHTVNIDNPWGIYIDDNNMLYVCDRADGSIKVVTFG